MTIKYHEQIEQGSDEWLALRCGILTASEMKNIISPVKLEPVKNPAHLYELLSQRITGYVEPQYISDDMVRGMNDEIDARALYAKHYAPVKECGFITNNNIGITFGYSPDGLVGDDGLIECKSRRQKYQVETITTGTLPDEYRIQVQTGLMVSNREWCDFISYSAGLPMFVLRVFNDVEIQDKILKAAVEFENKLAALRYDYDNEVKSKLYLATERKPQEQELVI